MLVRLLLVASLSCLASMARAQTLRGTATAGDRAAPVPGVVVLLVDSAGGTVRRALTDERGDFTIVAPAAGRYRVRALRIGFRPTTIDDLSLAAGEMRRLDLRLADVPAVLERVVVSTQRGCRARADAGVAAADLWEAARAALHAQQLTAASRAYDMRSVLADRWFAVGGRTPSREQRSVRTGPSVRAFASLPVDSLAARGYVQPQGGDVLYHGPDADVLLSDRFARDHCFSLVASNDPAQRLVGLAFRPPERRDTRLVDVSGTIWLDRASSELRHIEFAYEGLPVQQEGVGRGRVEYLRLPTGGWIIQRWEIHMPVIHAVNLTVPDGSMSRLRRERRLTVAEVQVASGEVTDVRQLRGAMLWTNRTARLAGSISTPEIGAVQLRLLDGLSPPRALTIDPSGRFVADSLSRGPLRLVVQHRTLDSLALVPDTLQVIADSVATPVVVTPPSLRSVVRRLCGGAAGDTAMRVIVGQVRDDAGRVQPRVTVRASWQMGRVRNGTASLTVMERETRSDGTGRYVLCELPSDKTIQLRASRARTLGPVATVQLTPARAYRAVDLSLTASTAR